MAVLQRNPALGRLDLGSDCDGPTGGRVWNGCLLQACDGSLLDLRGAAG